MPRVASLYLPNLPIDRLRQMERSAGLREPLVTVRRAGQQMTIAAACPAAQALGLRPPMALAQARAMVPDLDIREADAKADMAVLNRLGRFAARRWTPRVSLSGTDGLWLDLNGVAHLFGGERNMCERILRFCGRLGYRTRIAVAGTAGAAHALARHGPEPIILCPSGCEAEAIAPLPIAALRVEEEEQNAAHRLGIRNIADLFALQRGPLSRRFRPAGPNGRDLLARLDQALGRIAEPFHPIVPQDAPSATLRLIEPIATAEAIEQVMRDLVAILVEDLEKSGLGIRLLDLLCLRVDGEEQRIVVGTARATRDEAHLLRLLCAKITSLDPGFGIELMRLTAVRCEPLAPEMIDIGLGGEKRAPDLAPLIDRLAGRLGRRRLFRASAVESDIPERSISRVGPLAATSAWPDWPRPILLLSPPERVENVMAELPDHPPLRFSWRGHMHIVRHGDGPERIFGEWWKHGREAEAVRDYFQVEDEQGARFWLYRRGDGDNPRTGDLGWYLHGLFG